MNHRLLIGLLVFAFFGCGTAEQPPRAVPFDTQYTAYASALQTAVHGDLVDYDSLRANRHDLDTFIAQLASLSAEAQASMSRHGKMALWINAYNAITLVSVLNAYPVESIRDIDGVWDKREWLVAGRDVTLDRIEHQILRPEFKDPRLHFAVNCASVGCPPLREEPFMPVTLDDQLDQLCRAFVNNPGRNLIDPSSGTVKTSEIFSWFGEDFLPHYGKDKKYAYLSPIEAAVLDFIATYADERNSEKLATVAQWKLEYLPYDWSLNQITK